MAVIKITQFGGEAPSVSDRALPPSAARATSNLYPRTPEFRPLATDTSITPSPALVGSNVQSLYRFNRSFTDGSLNTNMASGWVSASGFVNFARGMLNDNITERTYITAADGSAEPVVGYNNNNGGAGYYSKTLGVPAPAAKPVITPPTANNGFTAALQDAAKKSLPVALATALKNTLVLSMVGNAPPTLGTAIGTAVLQWVDPNDGTQMAKFPGQTLPGGSGKYFFLIPTTTTGGVTSVDAPFAGYSWIFNPALSGLKVTSGGTAAVKEYWAIPYQYQAVGYACSGVGDLVVEIEKIPNPLDGTVVGGDNNWINLNSGNRHKTLQLANTMLAWYIRADTAANTQWTAARPTSAVVSAGTPVTYVATKEVSTICNSFQKFQDNLLYTFATSAAADAAALATGLTVKELNAAKVTNAARGQSDLLVCASSVTAVFDATNANVVNVLAGQTFWEQGISPLLPPIGAAKRQTTFYVTTLVTAWGEESAPSPPAGPFTVDLTYEPITVPRPVELVDAPTVTKYGLVGWRLYRSNSGTSDTAFQLVVPTNRLANGVETNGAFDYLTTTTLNDTKKWSELAEVLPSLTWLPPPKQVKGSTTYYLAGITQVTNGVMAGFIDNNLYFCEPYQPYAWPEGYRLTTKDRIIGLANFGQTLAVLTAGAPYLCSGADSASMSLQELPSVQACVSARSIVATENGVIYASPDGLCMVSLGGVSVITEGLFTRADWQALTPSSIFAEYHDGVYYFKFSGTTTDGVSGSGICYALDFAAKKLTRLDLTCSTFYNDTVTDTLYAVNGTNILALFNGSTNRTGVYRTSLIKLEKHQGFAWLQIDSDFAATVTLQWYGDGVLRFTKPIFPVLSFANLAAFPGTGATSTHYLARDTGKYYYWNGSYIFTQEAGPAPIRLPAGRYLEHQLVLTTSSRVTSVTMAGSLEELQSA